MAKNIGSLKDPKLFKAWLNQIVTNVFYDYVKKHSKSSVSKIKMLYFGIFYGIFVMINHTGDNKFYAIF